MNDTLERQLLLHDAAALCNLGLLRAATFGSDERSPAIALGLDGDALLQHLGPALDLVWADRPGSVDDLESFLREAYGRIVTQLNELSGDDGFVPAARWTDSGRELLLEHLKEDVEAIIGGARTEGLWLAFGETGDTAPLVELIHSGMLIKLRAVGAFLVLKPAWRDDELTAAQFFPAGVWEDARDQTRTANVLRIQGLVHKQVAHLTVTRPLPEERFVYRPSSYAAVADEVLALLEDFTAAVDARLLPTWWPEWTRGLRER